MPFPKTLSELTNGQFNEITYNAAAGLITGNFVPIICDLIRKCGIEIASRTSFDDVVYDALKSAQIKLGLTPTGILTNTIWSTMVYFVETTMSDTISDDSTSENSSSEDESTSPHYNSFFGADNYKIHRRNNKDIKIVFGNNSVTKTIKNVFMRGVTVEVDTSGNPISEIYEFIAQDITESDEMSDSDKYLYTSQGHAQDVPRQYDFSGI